MATRCRRSINLTFLRHYNPHRTTVSSLNAQQPLPTPLVHDFLSKLGVPTLPDKIAVQTLTHKSYNHGAEGYNEKLAFCGRRILEARISKYLISRPSSKSSSSSSSSSSLSPSSSPSSSSSSNSQVTDDALAHLDLPAVRGNIVRQLCLAQITSLASSMHDLTSVMRWKPKDAKDAKGSGMARVAGETLCAIIGVVDLQFGAAAATKFVDDKIIPELKLDQAN